MQDLKIIAGFVAEQHGLTLEQLKSKNRHRTIVKPRQIAHWMASEYTKHSLAEIGANIGGKDHATVLHSKKTVNNLLETDKKYASQFESMRYLFNQRVKPYLDTGYNYEELLQQKSNKRFEIQRRHYENKMSKMYIEIIKVMSLCDKTIIESNVIEGFKARMLKESIQEARNNLREIKLTGISIY